MPFDKSQIGKVADRLAAIDQQQAAAVAEISRRLQAVREELKAPPADAPSCRSRRAGRSASRMDGPSRQRRE
jgi:hypothetical protein